MEDSNSKSISSLDPKSEKAENEEGFSDEARVKAILAIENLSRLLGESDARGDEVMYWRDNNDAQLHLVEMRFLSPGKESISWVCCLRVISALQSLPMFLFSPTSIRFEGLI